jgi:hypothetical protein
LTSLSVESGTEHASLGPTATPRRLSGKFIQHPEGNGSPGIVATLLLGIARLDVSIIVDIPRQGVVDKVGGDRVGARTGIRGLSPGAVAPDGVVASLKFGVATVLEGASKGAVLPTLVSVESVVLSSEVASLVVVVGLHVPVIVDVPNGEVIGSGATKGVKAMEGDDDGIGLPIVPAVLLAGLVAELVIAVVGHTAIEPSEVLGIGLKPPV